MKSAIRFFLGGLLLAAVILGVAPGSILAAATLSDIGSANPTPGANDISQLLSSTVNAPGGLNYYDNNANNTGTTPPGQTFTTGSNPAGYILNTVALKTSGGGSTSPAAGSSTSYALYVFSVTNLSAGTATLIASYSATTAFTQSNWLQWANLGLVLQPNSLYAFAHARTGNPGNAYERISVSSGSGAGINPYTGGQIATIPAAGGTMNFGSSGTTYDMSFDLGLVPATNTVWTGASSSNWDKITANWTITPPGSAGLFADGFAAAFGDPGVSQFNVNLASTVVPASVTFSNSVNNYSINGAGAISGSGRIVLTGTGTVSLNNTNTFTGGATIGAGATLTIGGAGQLGGGTFPGSITDNGTFNYASSANQNLTGIISGTGGLTVNAPTGAILTIGPGTNTTTAYSYTGPTVVNSGTLQVNFGNNSVSGIHASSGLTINNGGTVVVMGSSALEGYGLTTPKLPITINAGGTLTTANVNGLGCELSGPMFLNGGTLSEFGNPLPLYGSWELDNQITVNGGSNTSIMSAPLMGPQEPGGTIINITSGGVSQTVPGIDLLVTGSFTNSMGTGDSGIILTGNGTMALAGASNNYAHGTTIGVGNTLLMTNAATIFASGVITNNGNFIFASTGPQTLSGVISGTGSLQVAAAGAALALNAADTYSGNTLVSAGTLLIGPTGSISNSPSITVSKGAVFDVSAAAAFTLGGNQSLLGSGTNNGPINLASGAKIFAGTNGGLGTNTFAGNLSLVAGSSCCLDLGPTFNGANDQIILSGAGASLNCGGASIAIHCGGTLDQANDYVLINVTGAGAGITGSFSPTPLWLSSPPANSNAFYVVTQPTKVVLHYNSSTTPALPVATNLPASSLTYSSATLNGQLTSSGYPLPSVTIYFGTNNGGTNPAAWGASVGLGLQSSSFGAPVSGLSPATTYFFAVAASNSVGTAWAQPSQSFITPAVSLAVVSNLPPANVTGSSATLNGQIIPTATQTPGVILYYGPNDGATNANAWSNRIVLGTQTGNFSYAAGGLSNNTTYFYTAAATNLAGVAWATPSQYFTTPTPQAVYTFHYDNARIGANTNETLLTPANVNTNTFGKLFTYTVDGYVYAQALIATNVNVPGKGVHNVVYVATENDTIYAFDADNYVPTPYWTNSFLNPGAGVTIVQDSDITAGYNNIKPQAGITATPVIDQATGTIYAEAVTKETSNGTNAIVHRLHALDIATGLERTNFNSPAFISATNYAGIGYNGTNNIGGKLIWNGRRENARPALLLANGMVYICYAGFGDNTPYYGWVFSYDAHTLAQTGVFNTSPNAGWSGIWMTGNGAVADTNGFIYVNTGNGPYDTNSDFGDSIIKLNGTNGLKLADYFTPSYQAMLFAQDADVSAGGLTLLPPVNGTNLLLSGSKLGVQYLLNTTNMGQYNAANDNQIFSETTNGLKGQWSSPAYFNGMLYFVGCYQYNNGGDVIRQLSISNGIINTNPVAQGSYQYNYPGATPVVTASGTSNAIVWTLECVALSGSQAVLHAYNASNVALELYNSSQLTRDKPGVAVLFTAPTVANGKAYVGTEFGMSVYGLTTFISPPVISPNGGTYANSTTVTLSDVTSGISGIYYTVDGTVPGTNSLLYTAPFTITNSVIVQAIAAKAGAVNSGVAYASFVNTAAPGHGSGLSGQYWSNTSAAAFTNASFNTPPTLTRTDAVLNFNWASGGPDPTIGTTNFIVRWTGAVQAQYNENYTFTTIAEDGVRLWVNGQLLVNDWNTHASPATNSGLISLKSQQIYNIQLDYFLNTGSSTAQLLWSSPSTAPAVLPQSQLYSYTNPPPAVVLIAPTNGATFVAAASVSISADADALYNPLSFVSFYTNGVFLGTVSNAPYALTATGLAAGSYVLTASATDGSGLTATSAPVTITVTASNGAPYGLTSNGAVAPFLNQSMPGSFGGSMPALLSQTGAYTSTPNRTPAAGLIPYVPNTPLWSDGAAKSRYLAVPNNATPVTPGEQIGFAPTGQWTFPSGTVFVKNFDLVVDQTNPNIPLRRLETRLLVCDTNGAVYGVTYKWRPDNSDADLLTGSLTEAISVTNASGVTTQNWYYPSSADCLACHTHVAGYVLGLNTRQLNGTNNYPATGVTDNQLRTLNRLGILYPAFNETNIAGYSQLSSITNQSVPLIQRVRSYLDANCAQCHQPGGTGITFDARYDTPFASQSISNFPAVFTLGLDNARIIAPNDIWRSTIYARMNSLVPSIKMPNLARNLVDTNALQVVAAWINSMGAVPALAPPTLNPASGIFTNQVSITAQPPDTNAVIYYTLDGSLPSTNSTRYVGPFNVTSTATVRANAFETNYVNSIAATGLFTIVPPINTIFSPGYTTNGTFQFQYWAAPGQTYILQTSTDLIHWTPLSTNQPATAPFTLTDPSPGGVPFRFYRIFKP